MAEAEKTGEDPILNSNDLAFERTILAENRTLMAWIRTAISLISFGFTIYKFFHELGTQAAGTFRLFSPRKVGIIMIFFGMLALLWGLMEYDDTAKKLKKSYPPLQRSKSRILAMLIMAFGIILLLAAIFRQ